MSLSGSKKAIIIVIPVLILILIATAIYFVMHAKGYWNRDELPVQEWQDPGSAAENSDWVADVVRREKLEARLLKLCGTELGIASYYILPIRSEALPAERSTRFNSTDQLLYGRYLAEQNRIEDFTEWHKNFRKYYISNDTVVSYIDVNNNLDIASAETSYAATLNYVSVLMSAYQAKPQLTLLREIEELSELLLEEFADGIPEPDMQLAIPTVAPAPDPAATPTPAPIVSPTPEPAPIYDLIRLASIDLKAMYRLTDIDQRWQTIYEKWLAIVSSGLISEQLPLYALAVWPQLDNYLNFIGDSGAVASKESTISALSLAEVGAADQRAIRWINDQLLNNFAIYETYNIIQGHSMTQIENPSVYGLTARIGRVLKDRTLYEKSIERLIWHTATSQRSDALDAIFRQDENGVVTVWAEDNLWALLAYY